MGRALLQTSKKGGGAGLATIPAGEAAVAVGYAYSRPVLVQAPKYVRGAAAVVGTGYAFDYFQSQASSASSYQQHGGAGGTSPSRRFKNIDAIPAGSRVIKPLWKTTTKHAYGGAKSGYHYCKKGWVLVRVGDTNMCWKPPQKKKS